jgi:hypothetical protein
MEQTMKILFVKCMKLISFMYKLKFIPFLLLFFRLYILIRRMSQRSGEKKHYSEFSEDYTELRNLM